MWKYENMKMWKWLNCHMLILQNGKFIKMKDQFPCFDISTFPHFQDAQRYAEMYV